ncbi:MAG: ABC transporter permease [Thermoleophilia bacterium]|nr:ABC transporter permease [Thermoleophilia bacterium]
MLVYPLARLVSIAVGEPDGLGNLADWFSSRAHRRVLQTTFVDAAIATVVCLLIGSVLAWCLRTTRSAAVQAALWGALLLPFLMGSVLKLYALTVMLQDQGVLNRALTGTGVVDEPITMLYNQFAVTLGLTYQMLPFAVLPLLAGFHTIDPDLVTAAESLGASRVRALLGVVVPLSVPTLLATGAIVYIINLGFFLTPEVLGGATSPFMAALISQDMFLFFDAQSAAVSSLVLLVGAILVLALSYALVGRERLARAVAA